MHARQCVFGLFKNLYIFGKSADNDLRIRLRRKHTAGRLMLLGLAHLIGLSRVPIFFNEGSPVARIYEALF